MSGDSHLPRDGPRADLRGDSGSVPTVSVIIPTKDRPGLLDEAIASALAQTRAPNEVVVVDDGSTPPVDAVALSARHGPKLRVMRNESSRGLAFCRNLGVEACTSDHVLHLDDDDLLAANAIATCLAAATAHPEVGTWFLGVRGFGSRCEHFNKVQPEGVSAVCAAAKGVAGSPGVVVFDRQLFAALLHRVPMAFQRVFTTRDVWATVSRLRWRAYMLDQDVPDEASARLVVKGTLRDSEWARYAAATCERTGLLDQPLYLQRCEGQGYSSQPAMRHLHAEQGQSILRHLAAAAEHLPELACWRSDIVRALADAYFDAAYQHQQTGDRRSAWHYLRQSMALGWAPHHLRLGLRLCMPKVRNQA